MTNHKQEAEDLLDGTLNPFGSPTEALAHATLALVEQQRIANLIAYLQIHANDSLDQSELYVDLHYASKLMQEAADALGIKP